MDLLPTEDKYHITQLLGGRAGILTQACSNLAATSLKKNQYYKRTIFVRVCVSVHVCMWRCLHMCVCACAHMEVRG